MKQKPRTHLRAVLAEWGIITLGTAIVAAAVFFFLVPSKLSVGSVSGLAIVLANVIPLPVSAITMALNVLFLVLGFLLIGGEFGVTLRIRNHNHGKRTAVFQSRVHRDLRFTQRPLCGQSCGKKQCENDINRSFHGINILYKYTVKLFAAR